MTDRIADADKSVAIIGMAGRFPGAPSVDAFWNMILEGREGVRFFSDDELDASIPDDVRAQPNYVPAKGVIDQADCFDEAFFGLSPMEAAIMDPQQRVSLEVAWHALEDASVVPGRSAALIGVYAGSNWSRYRDSQIRGTSAEAAFGTFNTSLASEPEFLATRLAYKLDLKGPAITVSTACSTSLVAIAEASKALLAFDCDVALAGGASISTPLNAGYLHEAGGMLSCDGHCRSFDAQASGTTFNDGVAFVVLKRTSDALADGDRIYATVRGFGINNDGASKVSFTAPSIEGQASAITSALEYADVPAASIRLIEAHGTATPMGDPIEIDALKRAFAPVTERGHCAVGSVKSNVGHLVHAAGAAGFIKSVLAVHHGVLPPSLHFKSENPKLGLASSPFFVNTERRDWPGDARPRRAGVSSFGVGGTNAHVVIEQAPDAALRVPAAAPCWFGLSARTPDALEQRIAALSNRLSDARQLEPASVARVLQAGRHPFTYRAAWVPEAGRAHVVPTAHYRGEVATSRSTTFLFSGQGSQRPEMGLSLAQADDTFGGVWRRGLAHLEARFDIDLERVLRDANAPTPLVQRTEFAQPALYLYEVAKAQTLRAAGLSPDWLVGHSVGEFAAATVAGVMTLETGLDMVVARGRAMQAQPDGNMVAVFTDESTARDFASDDVVIAAVNARALCVLSGPTPSIENVRNEIAGAGIDVRDVRTSHAFHSPMMAPAVDQLREAWRALELAPPSCPVVSTVTGRVLSSEQATSADYWAEQILAPVRFADAVAHVVAEGSGVALETGPGSVLSSLIRMDHGDDDMAICPDLGSDVAVGPSAAAFAWTRGAAVSVPKEVAAAPLVSLTGYPFAPTRHWIDKATVPAATVGTAPDKTPPVENEKTREMTTTPDPADHRDRIVRQIVSVLEDISGFDLGTATDDEAFLDLGFDSILLTQAAQSLKQAFGAEITFRQLMEDLTTIGALADRLEPEVAPAPQVRAMPTPVETESLAALANSVAANGEISEDVRALIQRQLDLMRQQLSILTGASTRPASASEAMVPAVLAESAQAPPRRGPGTRIARRRSTPRTLTNAQKRFIEQTIEQYTAATAASKAYVTEHRSTLADPRTVSGFKPEFKEMVYPIVTRASKGSRLTDIDGRDYIDITNGFGPIFFGHSPDFINEAVIAQIQAGVETGPQSPLAGEVAALCAELTGNERIAFASTGSEAVCCALRLARTVTGRQKVVVFEGAYHGIFDEVVIRPGRDGAGLPAAPGIPREMTANMIVLPWGSDESVERIRAMADELAAVMVEPVQSRNPGVQPAEFLRAIRDITSASGSALIFDEVVTGFRVAPGGAQEYFDIRADMATYGKVVGGGYPIGLIGGTSRFMDALDGGAWQFGDDSAPEVGVTFFAGTFVRHPVALAAAHAVLLRLKDEGPALQRRLAATTENLVVELLSVLDSLACTVSVRGFSSYFYISVPEDEPYGELLFYLLRLYGVHAWNYRPCFLTTSHSAEDLAAIVDAFRRAVSELVRHGLLTGDAVALERLARTRPDTPPVEGARLGKDASGAPAWFVPDPDQPGKYKMVARKRIGTP
ncbi:MAG: aminotransferase class III-fold pyridoxal phosphate-dependent enzyme [Pseudomonadota bacterium]